MIALFSVAGFGQKTGTQLVRDADNPIRQPFFKMIQVPSNIEAPWGKVMVIESITGSAKTSTGEVGPLVLWVTDISNQTFAMHTIAPSYHNAATNTTFYTQQGRFYVVSGQSFDVQWYGVGSPTQFHATISGYYVNQF